MNFEPTKQQYQDYEKNPIYNDEKIDLLHGVDVPDDTQDRLDIINCAFNLHTIDYVDLFQEGIQRRVLSQIELQAQMDQSSLII